MGIINDSLFLSKRDVHQATRAITTMAGTGMACNAIDIVLLGPRHVCGFYCTEAGVARILLGLNAHIS